MITALVQLLILLLVVGLVVWIAQRLVDSLPIDETFRQVARAVVWLIALLLVLAYALPMAGLRIV